MPALPPLSTATRVTSSILYNQRSSIAIKTHPVSHQQPSYMIGQSFRLPFWSAWAIRSQQFYCMRKSQMSANSKGLNPQFTDYHSKAEALFGNMSYHDKTEQELQASIEQLRAAVREIQQLLDHKIEKYFPQLRERNVEKEPTVEELISNLKNEVELRKALIGFQQSQMKDVKAVEVNLDGRQNVQFAIPIQINQTRKRILQLEKFIHIAQIKQKKKSEDVVKVDKTNAQQFQRIAMLRKTLQVEMIYELSLNDREMKLDDKVYDFQSKLEALDEKLARLGKIVEERHILVSSNKQLLQMQHRKIAVDTQREDLNRRIALANSATRQKEQTLIRDIEKMKRDLIERQERYVVIQQQLQDLMTKDASYLTDTTLTNSLRKSISYNYAETLLKLKKKEQLANPHPEPNPNLNLNRSLLASPSLKPNFNVKTRKSQGHSSLAKSSKKDLLSVSLSQPPLPVTLVDVPDAKRSSVYNMRSSRKISKKMEKDSEEPEEEIVVDQ